MKVRTLIILITCILLSVAADYHFLHAIGSNGILDIFSGLIIMPVLLLQILFYMPIHNSLFLTGILNGIILTILILGIIKISKLIISKLPADSSPKN